MQTKQNLFTHCRRAASVAVEIAHRLGLPQRDRQLVGDAALLHHHPAGALDPFVLQRLTGELRREGPPAPEQPHLPGQPYQRDLLEILLTFHSCSIRGTDRRLSTLADLIRTSNLLAESFELAAAGEDPRERVLNRLRVKVEEGLVQPAILKALEDLPRIRKEQLPGLVSRLPVYAGIALKVLALAADENVSFPQLESLISADQVLAGRIIHVANSWAYSPRQAISTIGLAVSYIGMDQTRKIVTAASFQPLFASANMRELWKHSLEVARLCEQIAGRCARFSREEAFLAGLVHDVGRLAIWKLPAETGSAYVRMTGSGCDAVFAERFLFGFDHGEAGAEILRRWNFPEHLVEAVRFHQQPSQSTGALASLLYLAESQCGPSEDAVSGQCLANAWAGLGIDPASLDASGNEAGALKFLTAVA